MKCLVYFRFFKFDDLQIYYILSQFFLFYFKADLLIHLMCHVNDRKGTTDRFITLLLQTD